MPVIMNPLGTVMDVQLIDENFERLESFLFSSAMQSDLIGTFKRLQVRQYTSGKLVRAHSMVNPIYKEGDTNYQTQQTVQKFDLTYRPGDSAESQLLIAIDATKATHRPNYAMELLGRPGPSFYYNFQEDDLPDPSSFPAAGWPPTLWPPDRYDRHLCFSRWLTIPGCSLKLDVPHGATARITTSATGALTMFSQMAYTARMAAPIDDYPHKSNLTVEKLFNAYRFGIIVDTNPLLDDEFPNSNRHILDPQTGLQAPYCSWQVLEDKSFYAAQRDTFKLKSEVQLRGGKRYNFRFAFRDAATHGHVTDNGGVLTWYDDIWETNIINTPPATLFPAIGIVPPYVMSPFNPPWINFWDSAGLAVELDYVRSAAWIASPSSPDFSKP